MKVLAVDTATKVISVALLDTEQINPLRDKTPKASNGCLRQSISNGIKAEMHQPYSKSQGSALIPVIKRLFEEAGYHIKGIELFCVGLGPGSFTGLRTSVATMRSLSIALGEPIIGISSFDVIACNVAYSVERIAYRNSICVMFDARQNKVYARFYRHRANGVESISDFLLDSLENILSRIKKQTVIAGDAIAVYGSEILEQKRDFVLFA